MQTGTWNKNVITTYDFYLKWHLTLWIIDKMIYDTDDIYETTELYQQ